MEKYSNNDWYSSKRFLIIGIISVISILFLNLITITSCNNKTVTETVTSNSNERTDWLAESKDMCVVCHRATTPGIVQQFG